MGDFVFTGGGKSWTLATPLNQIKLAGGKAILFDPTGEFAERGLRVSHTTILRWVIHYVPKFEKRWNRWGRRVHSSWKMDETYIRVQARWYYLYRAVDEFGKTVDFLLRPDRGVAAAQEFSANHWPRAYRGGRRR